MIRVTQADVPEVIAFLEGRPEYVMFPLNNLLRYGLDGDHSFSPRMWRNEGEITDIIGITTSGMVMPYLPHGAGDVAEALTGQNVVGIVGPASYARDVLSALGFSGLDMALDADETHFSLDLDDLVIPDGTTTIAALSEDHVAVLTPWLIDYHMTELGQTRAQADEDVPLRLTRALGDGTRVVLMDGDTPVATTAFNAALPQIVQIGGVYTPPALRGRGYARRAVALHLAQVRAEGATRATLFANNPSAIAAYMSVGFRRIGDWALKIFKVPQVAR